MSKSLVKAINLLDCFKDQPTLTLMELTEKSGLPKTTVFRLVSSLEEAGLIIKDRNGNVEVTYRLGLKLLQYGNVVKEGLEINKIALPHMRELNDDLDELVHLTVSEGNQAVYVETIGSKKPVRLVVRVGQRAPLYAGSAPKVLLAYKSEEEIDDYLKGVELKKLALNTLTDEEEIKAGLKVIYERGYSISRSEHFKDTIGFSAPIFDYNGKVVAALGVSTPMRELTEQDEDTILSSVIENSLKISRELGYEG
ncbi:IclR family transcriptional regulator [Piscibacillus salipiscarius]|uniref:IclR family transcriptional regulator n=1 Tax=Piscibacillus salipiscarius TaxID=299480 RepID=A0ABW5QAQ0_9BACI|nr:IclR family transcriptional regulator [Piscibacillus salipiscarius]